MVIGPTVTDIINEILKLDPTIDRKRLYRLYTKSQLKKLLNRLQKEKGLE